MRNEHTFPSLFYSTNMNKLVLSNGWPTIPESLLMISEWRFSIKCTGQCKLKNGGRKTFYSSSITLPFISVFNFIVHCTCCCTSLRAASVSGDLSPGNSVGESGGVGWLSRVLGSTRLNTGENPSHFWSIWILLASLWGGRETCIGRIQWWE